MSLLELQSAVTALPPAELDTFWRWFQTYLKNAEVAPADRLTPDDIPQWHKEELDRRLAEAEANPGSGRPWREVLDELGGGR